MNAQLRRGLKKENHTTFGSALSDVESDRTKEKETTLLSEGSIRTHASLAKDRKAAIVTVT